MYIRSRTGFVLNPKTPRSRLSLIVLTICRYRHVLINIILVAIMVNTSIVIIRYPLFIIRIFCFNLETSHLLLIIIIIIRFKCIALKKRH